jgi:alcohol dehydrogenase (cytochrome c)
LDSCGPITPKNAGDLREACEISLGDEGIFQSGPLVVGDTLFVTTVHTLVAVSATDCSLRWRYAYEPQGDEPLPANRGAAYLDGRLFRGTGDGWVLAIDAKKPAPPMPSLSPPLSSADVESVAGYVMQLK